MPSAGGQDRAAAERGDREARRIQALRDLSAYRAPDQAQAEFQARLLAFLETHEDALERSCAPGHLTASALVLDPAGERALLLWHKQLGRWLQPGGHIEADKSLLAAALREVREETGLENLLAEPGILDLDIHPIPARTRPDGRHEPEHLHLDVRFLLRCPRAAPLLESDESSGLGWYTPAEVQGLATDASVLRLFQLAFDPR